MCPCSVRVGARRGREASVRVSRLVGKLLFGMPRVGEHLPPRERRGLCISNPSVYIPVESVPLTRSGCMIAVSPPKTDCNSAATKGATDPIVFLVPPSSHSLPRTATPRIRRRPISAARRARSHLPLDPKGCTVGVVGAPGVVWHPSPTGSLLYRIGCEIRRTTHDTRKTRHPM